MTALFAAIIVIAFLGIVLFPKPVSAHCDTLDGPAVKDGRLALETGNINHALKWISVKDEAELKEIFDLSIRVRGLSDDARTVADRLFLENMIRIHRSGEGAPYTGLKPRGTPLEDVVVAADNSIAAGNMDQLRPLVPAERLPELERRFHIAVQRKAFDVNDVPAGREYIEAYVSFFKLAEGEEHEHHHEHQH